MEKNEYLPLAALGAAQGAWKYYVRPEITARRAWLGLGALILAYELAAPEGELLSESVDRGLQSHKMLVVGSVCLTAAHLLNVLPNKIDPFHQIIKAIKPY